MIKFQSMLNYAEVDVNVDIRIPNSEDKHLKVRSYMEESAGKSVIRNIVQEDRG